LFNFFIKLALLWTCGYNRKILYSCYNSVLPLPFWRSEFDPR